MLVLDAAALPSRSPLSPKLYTGRRMDALISSDLPAATAVESNCIVDAGVSLESTLTAAPNRSDAWVVVVVVTDEEGPLVLNLVVLRHPPKTHARSISRAPKTARKPAAAAIERPDATHKADLAHGKLSGTWASVEPIRS